jgi:dolichol-phosphate mannosyltransferase
VSGISAGGLRLLKFSLVGGIGIAVQLAVLAALTAMRVNYLLATGLAVESAVLHNFLWHQRFTWADRANTPAEALRRLLLFHLTNGAISIVGNLLLIRLLVGWLGFPVLKANMATIALCAMANFAASDRWVFVGDTKVTSLLSLARASTPTSAGQTGHK